MFYFFPVACVPPPTKEFFLILNYNGNQIFNVAFLFQELEKSDCAALRNNLVVMMADFCVRYTALVDW